MMDDSETGDRSDANERKPTLAEKISGQFILIVTVIVAFVMLVSVCQAYSERHQRLLEYKSKLDPDIKAMESRVEQATEDALKRLDPDYRRAEYEYGRKTLGPGEELLPTYDGSKEEKH